MAKQQTEREILGAEPAKVLRYQWNVPVREDLFDEMKGLAQQNGISMPKITELAFELYLEKAIKEIYTNESETDKAINDLKERVATLEQRLNRAR